MFKFFEFFLGRSRAPEKSSALALAARHGVWHVKPHRKRISGSGETLLLSHEARCFNISVSKGIEGRWRCPARHKLRCTFSSCKRWILKKVPAGRAVSQEGATCAVLCSSWIQFSIEFKANKQRLALVGLLLGRGGQKHVGGRCRRFHFFASVTINDLNSSVLFLSKSYSSSIYSTKI